MVHDDWRKAAWRVDRKSDLYVYFYLRGLALLNPKGTFCYISSNSWLDVGYGKGLQEFLLKHGRVHAIYDNEVKRSFKRADVNTIIAVLGIQLPVAGSQLSEGKSDGRELTTDNEQLTTDNEQLITRFVMFKQQFEAVVTSDLLLETDTATERKLIERTQDGKKVPYARVFPMTQGDLWKAGVESAELEVQSAERKAKSERTSNSELSTLNFELSTPFAGTYCGNKWGGKYLRAPDIYWKILEKGKGKLVRLGDIAEVRFGIKTGANDFFYLEPLDMSVAEVKELSEKNPSALVRVKNGAGWVGEIEARFLKPVIKTPRDYYQMRVAGGRLLLFLCKDDRNSLVGKKAASYISWGESKGLDTRPSCAGRTNWYSVQGPMKPKMLWPSAFFERHIVYECPNGYVADKVFYTISGNVPPVVRAFLNSTVTSLFVEVEGYQLNHGGIFVTTDWLADMPVLRDEDPELARLYERIAAREVLLCSDELSRADRRALDARVLELVGVDVETSLMEVYPYVREHVAERIHKARREVTRAGRHDAGREMDEV